MRPPRVPSLCRDNVTPWALRTASAAELCPRDCGFAHRVGYLKLDYAHVTLPTCRRAPAFSFCARICPLSALLLSLCAARGSQCSSRSWSRAGGRCWGADIHCKLKYKKPHSWYKMY
eukprot:3192324-Rhodomonas_salina.1